MMAQQAMRVGNSAFVQRYLERLQLRDVARADAQTLAHLQCAHLHRVPYENLDILMGKPLSLDPESVFQKVVERGRGGYCFELNALFRHLLEALGYSVTSHFARFWQNEPDPPPKPRHHVLIVPVDGERYLVDVGVGEIVPRWPIMLRDGWIQRQGEECYRVRRVDFFGWMLERQVEGAWMDIFSFTEEPRLERDFITTSYWCEHAQESIFRNQPMVMVRTELGRNTFDGRFFRRYTGTKCGHRGARQPGGADRRAAKPLRHRFGG